MDFSFAGRTEVAELSWFTNGLREVMIRRGHTYVDDADTASLVVNCFRRDDPRSFRRRGQAVFVVSLTELAPGGERTVREAIPEGYPLLVRSLSNLLIGITGSEDSHPDAHFITPEQGHYRVQGNSDRTDFFEKVYLRIEPLATSRLVIDNVFETDLPRELWGGDELTRSIARAGKRLDALDVLPTPFPIEEILSERDRRQLKRLYGLGGLSYGNISARYDETQFWMSASGVDKAKLSEVGLDILMVKDYDAKKGAMILSVPPEVEPRRVSVDAIEHWMIYREHPAVGAILHVHAWMEGVRSTEFNYPCGTYELGGAVAKIVRSHSDPARAVVGLKNHGLTITGLSLDEIFDRIEGRLLKVVPMS
ncbi:MAG: class II aldolase/adducin family protein [Gemmatimonadetes bacterium]|nr:class II aldolase/adducin family protein [Gemmatimonadota bacterium]